MTRLEELLYCLTSVIVRYHDIQQNEKLVDEVDLDKSCEHYLLHAKKIIQNESIPYKKQLADLIKQCSDTGRNHFLNFILHEVIFIKELLDKKSSMEPIKLEEYKKQIYHLFVDLKLLLGTPKHEMYKVSYSKIEGPAEKPIALSGLKNDGYFGRELCNSGEILNDGVLKRFNITIHSSLPQIKAITEQICMEHQNALLVTELLTKNEIQVKENLEKQKKLEELAAQHKELPKEQKNQSVKHLLAFSLFLIQFKKLQAKEKEQTKVIEQQQETIRELEQNINELQQQVDSPFSSFSFQ